MTISQFGFDNADITEAGFALLMAATGKVANEHGVTTGFTASAGAGTRQVSVSTGVAVAPGVYITSNAVETVTLDANPGSGPRTDYVVLKVDWGANTVTVDKVTGSSVTPPALTQTAGSLWHIPLARVSVPAGYAAAFTSTHITPCKPLPRVPQPIFRGTVAAGSVTSGSAVLSTLAITDPGWPYVLAFDFNARPQQNNNARARITLTDAAGATLGAAVTPSLTDAMDAGVHSVGSTIYTAPTTLTLTLTRFDGTGTVAVNSSNLNFVVVRQIPA